MKTTGQSKRYPLTMNQYHTCHHKSTKTAQFCGDTESATDNYDFQLLFIISLSLLNYKANI